MEKMREEARTTLLTFRWRYHIKDSELEIYDNTDLTKVPKANRNIQICMGYLIYVL